MAVSFHSVRSTDDCYVCTDTMANSDTVGHAEGGELHPAHRKCLKIWLETHDICPVCRTQVNVNSIFTWKDKAIKELKLMGKDAIFGGLAALAISLSLEGISHYLLFDFARGVGVGATAIGGVASAAAYALAKRVENSSDVFLASAWGGLIGIIGLTMAKGIGLTPPNAQISPLAFISITAAVMTLGGAASAVLMGYNARNQR